MAKTRYEIIKSLDVSELATYLCENIYDCDECPAGSECHKGYTAMKDFLLKEDGRWEG